MSRSISAAISSLFWMCSAFQLRQVKFNKNAQNIKDEEAAKEAEKVEKAERRVKAAEAQKMADANKTWIQKLSPWG
jgi:hypothetical protein